MGQAKRKKITDHETWLQSRQQGLGASEAAAVVGLSPWMNATDLWKIKTGQAQTKDLSDSDVIQRGKRMEPVLRDLFIAANPEYTVEYHEFDLIFQSDREWLFSTLDGEIKETDTGKTGILEIKTASPNGKAGWAKWDNQIPIYYMTQLCHQLLSTGFDFAILYACLESLSGQLTIRQYRFEREELLPDMEWLLEQETQFWQHVQNRTMPPMKLIF